MPLFTVCVRAVELRGPHCGGTEFYAAFVISTQLVTFLHQFTSHIAYYCYNALEKIWWQRTGFNTNLSIDITLWKKGFHNSLTRKPRWACNKLLPSILSIQIYTSTNWSTTMLCKNDYPNPLDPLGLWRTTAFNSVYTNLYKYKFVFYYNAL